MTDYNWNDERKCSQAWCCNGDCSQCDRRYETTKDDYEQED